MSARRVFGLALLAATALALKTAPARAAAADSVLVRVGGSISGRRGDVLDVPITVDLSGAPGRALGSYTATVRFNPALLSFNDAGNGGFNAPQFNTTHASDSGVVVLTAIQPSGASGNVLLFHLYLVVAADTGQSPVTITFSEMSATATSVTPFEDLTPLLRIVNGTFCKSKGLWGDVNGDGLSNSFDALVALSYVVGDSLDSTKVHPQLADVDGDGRVTSRDALIILSYAVGLPVPATRILLTAAGACGTGDGSSIVITPDSVELQVGQMVFVQFAILDSSGRAVTNNDTSGTVTSSDPSVATFDMAAGRVVGRGPGLTTLTVRIGASLAATLKVSVLARRTTWYVDVERARLAPTQTGSQALPFEFINDALSLAHNGDTVRVAGGTYEELVSAQVAVALLGDSLNRAVLDPRGAPSWAYYDDGVDLYPYAGTIELAHLDIRAGQTYLDAHDFFIHDVLVEGLGTQGNALELYSENFTPTGAARRSGPMRSSVPEALGNVLVDGLVVTADSLNYGILVDQADSVVIRNSTITRTQSGTNPTCGFGPYVNSGILVRQASVSYVHDNAVTNPACQGIGLFDDNSTTVTSDVGRITASHNRVIGAPGTGIGAGSRLVATDHNVVRGTGRVGSQKNYGSAAGIHVSSSYSCECSLGAPPDSVTSLADSIGNSGGRGYVVDTTGIGVIDSLIVDGTGRDSTYGGNGVDLQRGGSYWLSHSHISNVVYAHGVFFTGEHTALHTRGNHLADVYGDGITTSTGCIRCAPPVRPSGVDAATPGGGPGPQRVGPYTGGPDTLISVADTIHDAGSNSIYMEFGVYAQVDSAAIDSSGSYGTYLVYVARGLVRYSTVRGAYYGFYSDEVDTLGYVGDTAQGNYTGLYANGSNTPDSVRIGGSVFAGNSGYGVDLYYAKARVDTSVFVNNGTGLYLESTAAARVHGSRFQTNNIGMWMNLYTSANSYVAYSNFLSDTTAGAKNDGDGPTLVADTSFWGDATGPRCPGCAGITSTNDSVTGGVTYADFLTGSAATPAPPARLARMPSSVRVAAAPPPARRESMPVARPVVADVAAQRAAEAQAAQRSQRQPPPAWHAPSKARSHAVRVSLKRRG